MTIDFRAGDIMRSPETGTSEGFVHEWIGASRLHQCNDRGCTFVARPLDHTQVRSALEAFRLASWWEGRAWMEPTPPELLADSSEAMATIVDLIGIDPTP